MSGLSPTIAKLAATRLFAWHREQAKLEVGPLRKTIMRLQKAGVTHDVIMQALQSEQWQIALAGLMTEHLGDAA